MGCLCVEGGTVMKIRLEYRGTVLEYDGPQSRLWAVCIAAIYGHMVQAVADACGFPGVVVVAAVSLLALAIKNI